MNRVCHFVSFLIVLTWLVSCTNPPPYTAAGAVAGSATAHPAIITTAQADQYRRDAEATVQAYQMTVEANYQHVQEAATSTAVWLTTAQAISVQATQQSLAATGTAQAIELAALAQAATSAAQATATAQSSQMTATASAVSAQATAASIAATRQAWELAQAQSQAHREQVISIAAYVLLGLFSLLLLGLGGYFLWQLIPALIHRASLVRYGQHDNPLLLLNRNGRTVITDPLAMLQAAVTIDEQGHVTMPDLTPAELQTILAGGRLRLLMEQAVHAPGHPPTLPAEVRSERQIGSYRTSQTTCYPEEKVSGWQVSSSRLAEPETLNLQPETLPPVSWNQLAAFPGLALGIGHMPDTAVPTIISLDMSRTSHLFVAGMSGSGKTRRLLRPLVAQLLTEGFYAILMNESGADFQPFYTHPNVAVIRGGVAAYMDVFEAAMQEMTEREALLRQYGVSEWRRLSEGILQERPFTLLAIDEILALVNLLDPREQRHFWGLVAAFASRARKVGMCSVGLATDPTYRALGQGGLTYRSQCARISFRLIQASGSRAILDATGAETLADGQFLALLDRPGLVQGMSANPSDEELVGYLGQRRLADVTRPAWLTGAAGEHNNPTSLLPTGQPPTTSHNWLLTSPGFAVATRQHSSQPVATSGEAPPFALPLDATRPPTPEEQTYIRQLYEETQSKNEVCRTLYGFKDGKTYRWVSLALEGGDTAVSAS